MHRAPTYYLRVRKNMNGNKTRDQIEDKYKWDLSVLYASDNSWEDDYLKVEKELFTAS